MGRPVVLSNGQLFVGLDENGLVHDFYYPYVGLENLTSARLDAHKIGVWVDGRFSWTDDGAWQIRLVYVDGAMVSDIYMTNADLKITLQLHDYVDPMHNAFIRNIQVKNEADSAREIRLFMHQVFEISRQGRADTALYVPDEHYLLDYKGRYCLLIAAKWQAGTVFDQYAVGNYGIEGKAGTYVDAEDGELSDNAVEHGGVDSVLRLSRQFAGLETAALRYWVVAGASQLEIEKIHNDYKAAGETQVEDTVQYWRRWLSASRALHLPADRQRALDHSLLFIKAHCDQRGSVLASGDSSIFNYGRDYYCYCWPRDAAYALWPLIRLEHSEEARRFFEFARDTQHQDGYLMHKYQPDRAIGSTWHPMVHNRRKELAIQEDETAGVIFMLGEYFETTDDRHFLESLYHGFVVPAANFMANFIDQSTGLPHASYDLWEEKFLTSTYTTSIVIGALYTAAKLAKIMDAAEDTSRWKAAADSIRSNLDKLVHPDGYFVKGFLLQPDGQLTYDNVVDISSLYGPYMYAGLPLDDKRLLATAAAVEKKLNNATPNGGVIRYEGDNYFRTKTQYSGNPWIVCSMWYAQYLIGTGNRGQAEALLKWAVDRQLPSGALSEQFDPESGSPLGVTPLVWSHAELINSLLDLNSPES